MVKRNQKSAITQILLALVPYTKQNLLLSFSPHRFFNELEKTSSYSAPSLRTAFSRGKKDGVFAINKDRVSLSLKARQVVQPYIAQQLSGGGQLMVIFDIPEDFSDRRRKLRLLLRQFGFKQIQQSVWMSNQDSREVLFDSILDLDIADWVQLYEAVRID